MKSKLIVCQEDFLPEIENPSPEQIERALDDLIPIKYHFVILASEEPVQNCSFVQTYIIRGSASEIKHIKYLIETRFDHENKRFKQYEYLTADTNELKKMFRMFALGIIPDITGWTDITEDILEEIAEREKKADEQSA